jgi:two-component system response regulator YesN
MMEQRRVEIHYQIMQYLRVALGFEPGDSRRTDPWLETLRQHGKYLFESPKEGKPRDIIEQLVDFIDNNYMDEISVGQIAGDLNLTPNYLSQLFHKKTGTTFMKYLTRLRLIKARELLANPARQVREVAREVGYTSARHFSALFKTHEGITPTEYRIAHRSGSLKQ